MKATIISPVSLTKREMSFLGRWCSPVEELSPTDLQSNSLGNTDLLVLGTHGVTAEMIAHSKIKYIGVYAAGYDYVPQEVLGNGVVVTNTPNYCFQSVAELGLGYLEWLGLFQTKDRCFVRSRHLEENQKLLQKGKAAFGGIQGRDVGESYNVVDNALPGKNVGIIGLGKVGHLLARQLEKLGMAVAYYTRTAKNCSYQKASLKEIFQNAQAIYVTCALNEGTRELISEQEIVSLQPDSILINLARAEVISPSGYEAIYQRCAQNKLFFCDDLTFQAGNLESLVTTPHVGFNTVESRQRKEEEFISNIEGYLQGRRGKEINEIFGEVKWEPGAFCGGTGVYDGYRQSGGTYHEL